MSPRAAKAQQCARCGLDFAKARPELYEPSSELAQAFTAVLRQWHSPGAHAALLQLALGRGELAALARLYRIRIAQAPEDLQARRVLERVVRQATTGALTPSRAPPSRAQRWRSRAVAALFVLSFLVALFFLGLRL